MSDAKFPRDPFLPSLSRADRITEPAPAEEDPIDLMRELRAMLLGVSERMLKLETCLMRQEMAILTAEHKENTALFGVDSLRSRMLRVEAHLGLQAAE